MGPTESLIALLCALYLSDCWFVVSHAAVVFRSPLARAWTTRRAPLWFRTQASAWILLRILPPLGRHAVCEAWPIAVTPQFAVNRAALRVLGRDAQTLVPMKLEAANEARADGKRVLAGRTELGRAASQFGSRRMAKLLRDLCALPTEQRERHIESQLALSFDLPSIERRRDELLAATHPLLWACNVEFVYLIAALPAVLWLVGLAHAWIPLLAILVALQAWVLFVFVRAHRQLFPNERGLRRELIFQMSISPPLAIRAIDAVCRDALAGFHPLAVACALTPGAEFRELARKNLREARFGAKRNALHESVQQTRAWFDQRELAVLTRLVEDSGLDSVELLAPPQPESDARSYCPLCHMQFSADAGDCADCEGVALARWQRNPDTIDS